MPFRNPLTKHKIEELKKQLDILDKQITEMNNDFDKELDNILTALVNDNDKLRKELNEIKQKYEELINSLKAKLGIP